MNKISFGKKLGFVTLSLSMLAGLPSVIYASDMSNVNVTSTEEVNLKNDDTTITIKDMLTRSDIKINGNLSGSDPIIGKPRATAKTTTSANVYSIRAKADANNNGTGTSTTGWKTLSNTSIANSGQIVASTSTVRFTGHHQAKIKSTSNWVSTKDTTIDY